MHTETQLINKNAKWVLKKFQSNKCAIKKTITVKSFNKCALTGMGITERVHVNRSVEIAKHIESNENVDGTNNECRPLVRTPFASPIMAPLSSRHLSALPPSTSSP